MSDPFQPAATEAGFVEITISAGPYQSRKVTSRRPELKDVEADLLEAIKVAAGAGASLERAVEEATANKPAAAGQYGKPAGASQPSGGDLPFADSTVQPSDPSKCKHGDRTLYQGAGKKGWVCPIEKGTAGRCETIFV
jgi:hypothetical protein